MSDVASQILFIALCLLMSALSAASETALVALGDHRTKQLVEERGHRTLKLWMAQPERVIATLLVTNNIVNTLSAALMTDLMSDLGSPNAIAIATGVMTFLILAFGDVTPKALARQYAHKAAPLLMPLTWGLYWLLYPAVWIFGMAPRLVEWIVMRGKPSQKRPSITSEEIEYMIDLGVRQGVLDRERSLLLTSVLEFSDIVTREIMVPRLKVVAIPVEATKEEVLKVIIDSEHSRIPVYEESVDHIVGVLYVKTLLADLEMGRVPDPFDLRRYMRAPFFVPEQMKISRLLREFQRRKVHLAVVVDEFGGTSGVVALEDVVEEIVGPIQDEQDVEEGQVRVLADGTVVADAAITLRDLEHHLKVDFPDELDADSLGGFVTATAGKVPPVGSVVLWGGLRFTVRAGDERRVTRVEIRRQPHRPAGGNAASAAASNPDVAVMETAEAAAESDGRPEVHDGNADERRDA